MKTSRGTGFTFRNPEKCCGRVVEDGEGVIPSRTSSRTKNKDSIWAGANVVLLRGRWVAGHVRNNREVVAGKQRSYVSVDRISVPHPRFVLDRVVPMEEDLKNGPVT